MCDFKPGDEVVCVRVGPVTSQWLTVGERYVIREVDLFRDADGIPVRSNYDGSTVGVRLVGIVQFKSDGREGKFNAAFFRKVERRNDRLSIEAFMTMPGGFEEPRRPKAPAKKRERV